MRRFEIDDETRLSSSSGSCELLLNDDDVVYLLKRAIEREGSQSAFAKRYGVDRPNLNGILKGRRSVSAVLKALRLRKVYVVNPLAADGCGQEVPPEAKKEFVDALADIRELVERSSAYFKGRAGPEVRELVGWERSDEYRRKN